VFRIRTCEYVLQVCSASINRCCGSMLVRIRIGGSIPLTMDPDADPVPAIFVSDLQDVNKKFRFDGTFRSFLKIKSLKTVGSNVFLTTYFCLMIVGSGDGSGSIYFWASRIRIRIHQSEMRIRIRLWIRILLSSSKIVRKTLIPTVLWLLYDFLSLKNDVNVPLKNNKQKKLLTSWRSLTKIAGLDPQPDPDPLVKV
jgi:hypothetical protein